LASLTPPLTFLLKEPPPSKTTPPSLHDALPISPAAPGQGRAGRRPGPGQPRPAHDGGQRPPRHPAGPAPGAGPVQLRLADGPGRSEEHTSELQSLTNLACRLPLLNTTSTPRPNN